MAEILDDEVHMEQCNIEHWANKEEEKDLTQIILRRPCIYYR